MENQDNHKYDDIINLPNPTSKKHPRMSLYDRAAQFSPFAALTGHEAAIKETARQTDEKLMLSDEVIAELNEKLNLIAETIGTQQRVILSNVNSYVNHKKSPLKSINAVLEPQGAPCDCNLVLNKPSCGI